MVRNALSFSAARAPIPFSVSLAMGDEGLTLGEGTMLVRMEKATETSGGLALETDRDRFVTLMSVASGQPVGTDAFRHIEAADRFWRSGDKALANLRLVFAGLPRLADRTDAYRLTLAAHLIDEGMAPSALMKELGLNLATDALKYAPNQARIPAGHGDESGRFTFDRDPGAVAPSNRIVVASEDDNPSEDKDYLRHQGEIFPTPDKETTHPHHVPLLMSGPPPPTSRPLPPGIGPGDYANHWVPAVPGKRPDAVRQRAVNAAGDRDGCHICGTKDPGTMSGNYIGDHQDPKALNPPGRSQYFLPMCQRCSDSQGGIITQFKHNPNRGVK